MEDRLRSDLADGSDDARGVADIELVEGRGWWKLLAAARRQVVDDVNLVPVGEQGVGNVDPMKPAPPVTTTAPNDPPGSLNVRSGGAYCHRSHALYERSRLRRRTPLST